MGQNLQIKRDESKLFLKRWIHQPRQLGTLAPISESLAHLAAQCIFQYYQPEFPIIELGAGTGRLTRALIAQGVHPKNIIAVELDPELASFLQQSLPGVQVIQGDAAKLDQYLSPDLFGRLPVIVSVLPLMYFSLPLREEIIKKAFAGLDVLGHFFHVTYSPISPLKSIEDKIQRPFLSKRVVSKWINLPPGFVWHYSLKTE